MCHRKWCTKYQAHLQSQLGFLPPEFTPQLDKEIIYRPQTLLGYGIKTRLLWKRWIDGLWRLTDKIQSFFFSSEIKWSVQSNLWQKVMPNSSQSENYHFFWALFLLLGGKKPKLLHLQFLIYFSGIQTSLKKCPTVILTHHFFMILHFCLILSHCINYMVGASLNACQTFWGCLLLDRNSRKGFLLTWIVIS